MDLASLYNRSLPENLTSFNYTGVLSTQLLPRGDGVAPPAEVRRLRRHEHGHHRRHAGHRPGARHAVLGADVLRGLRARRRAQQRERRRQGHLLPVDAQAPDRTTSCSATTRSTTSASPRTTSRAATTGSSARRRSSATASSIRAGRRARSSSGIRSTPPARARTSARTRCSSTTSGGFGDRVTINLGVRWDKNSGKDSADQAVADDSAFSPRLAVYVGSDRRRRLDRQRRLRQVRRGPGQRHRRQPAAAAACRPPTSTRISGRRSTPTPTRRRSIPTDEALATLWSWFNANGGTNRPTVVRRHSRRQPRIGDDLRSPSTRRVHGRA